MSALWLVMAVGIAIAMLVLTKSWRRRDQEVDLGSVSDQWMAEQRTGQGHDSQR